MKRKLVTTENDVKAIVKRWFDKWTAWSYAPIQNGMGVHGIPDRVGCMPIVVTPEMVGSVIGLFVAVEAKKPGRRHEENAGATGLQAANLRDMVTAGGLVCLVDSEMDTVRLSHARDQLCLGSGNAIAAEQLERRINKNG